jgi:hypothetical protein
MDRIEILTRLALILRRMDRLAELATRDKEDLDSLRAGEPGRASERSTHLSSLKFVFTRKRW